MTRTSSRREGGFTLLELMLVIVILGITAMMVLPRVASFGAGRLKRESRRLSGLIAHLAQESSVTKRTFRLYYDLDGEAYWVQALQANREFAASADPLAARRALPEGVAFEDVVTPRHGKVREGEAYTEFFPLGVEKTTIHLKSGEAVWTLAVNPLTGRVKVTDRYIDRQERNRLADTFF